jgi:proline-rich protein PRCC
LQPAATNKGKPSKLHQRKHKIGSLFYEMKQKKMGLVDWHAKGHLSKAETQAKYSW